MRRSFFIDPVLFLLVAALLSVFSVGCSRPKAKEQPDQGSEGRPVDLAATRERIAHLRQQVDQQRANAVAAKVYTPMSANRIDDLAASASDILRQLPGVVQVETFAPADHPSCRIVHLRDWHFVPRDLYALDLRSASKKPLMDAEIDALHEELTLQVELVQLEQLALLRCLIQHHGLRRVHIKGLTKKDLPGLQAKVAALQKSSIWGQAAGIVIGCLPGSGKDLATQHVRQMERSELPQPTQGVREKTSPLALRVFRCRQ